MSKAPGQTHVRDSELTYPVASNALRDERSRRLQTLLEERGLTALLAFSTDSVTGRGNVRYLANWPTPIRQSAATMDLTGRTVLFVTHLTHTHWAPELGWADETRLVKELVRDSVAALAERMATEPRARVGIVGLDAVGGDRAALRRQMGDTEVVDLDEAFASLRRPSTFDKPFYELNGQIADHALKAVVDGIRPGMRENEVYGLAAAALRSAGCEDSLILLGSGAKHNMPIPSARVLEEGDVVRLSVEPCSPGGYWAQVARTISLGEPDDEVVEVHDAVLASLTHGLQLLGPGVPVRDVAKEIKTRLAKARSVRPEVVLGHGVGLNLAEAPRIAEDSTETLSEGMVLTVHPGAYRDTFGVFIGESVRITGDGAVSITSTPLQLLTVPV